MTPEQQSAYIAQKMSQFQAVREQVTSKCSQIKASPPSTQPMMPPRVGLLQNNPNPAVIPPPRHQSREGEGIDMTSPTLGKQQGIFNCNPVFPIPSRLGQEPLGTGHLQIPKAVPLGTPLPGFCPRPLISQLQSPHQLRQPRVPRTPAMFIDAVWAAAMAGTTAASRERPPSLRQSAVQGPVPVPSATKSLQHGMSGFGPVSPMESMEPPSYVAAAMATSQSLGPFRRMGSPPALPPYDFLPPPQPPLEGLLSGPYCREVDSAEALLKGPSASPKEGRVCNLRLIDGILEEHAAVPPPPPLPPESAGGL